MKKTKERKKINAFDVVVILLLVCLAATFGYRIYAGIDADNPNNNVVKYIVEFECDDEYDSLLAYLDTGDAVYFGENKLFGFLYTEDGSEEGPLSVISDNTDYGAVYTLEGISAANASSFQKVYNRVKLTGKLSLNSEATRIRAGDYYSVGGRNIREGSEIEVYTDTAEFTLTVTRITAVD